MCTRVSICNTTSVVAELELISKALGDHIVGDSFIVVSFVMVVVVM